MEIKLNDIKYDFNIFCNNIEPLFNYSMMDKKLIIIFRTFVEKTFLSNLKKTDPAYL